MSKLLHVPFVCWRLFTRGQSRRFWSLARRGEALSRDLLRFCCWSPLVRKRCPSQPCLRHFPHSECDEAVCGNDCQHYVGHRSMRTSRRRCIATSTTRSAPATPRVDAPSRRQTWLRARSNAYSPRLARCRTSNARQSIARRRRQYRSAALRAVFIDPKQDEPSAPPSCPPIGSHFA